MKTNLYNYYYSQSQQISQQTGLIGHIRGFIDGYGFITTWNGFRDDRKTDEFKKDIDDVFKKALFLKDRKALVNMCYTHMDAALNDNEYGFRIDTDKYSYLFRLNPNRGEYSYCYCYIKEYLDRHLKNAEKGIRFIDSNYKPLFTIKDGEKVRILFEDGSSEERICRYIDEYHVEVGYGSCNLFHICEFAERMERIGATYLPA